MGAEKGCHGKRWREVEEGAAKKGVQGGAACKTEESKKKKIDGAKKGLDFQTERHLDAMMDDKHSHMCISPHCNGFCTPTEACETEQGVRMYHTCADLYRSKQVIGLKYHMCRKCHQNGKVCKTIVCCFLRCSRSKDLCKHLHTP